MRLAVFDIDGTLTATNEIDAAAYETAVAGFLRLPAISSEWSRYPEVTDGAIFEYLCRERLGRAPAGDEIRLVQARLVALFEEAFALRPGAFAPIAGAPEFIRALQRNPDWSVVLATGAWDCSARFKLTAVGLTDLLMVGCDSAGEREQIVRNAMELGHRVVGRRSFERIVLVGDAPWDLATARRLDLGFVGVASGVGAGALLEQGASHVIPDFRDAGAAMSALEGARIPDGTESAV